MPFLNRPLWAWLPGFNIKYSFDDESSGTYIPPKRCLFEYSYPLFLALFSVYYTAGIIQTNSFNPIEQYRIREQKKVEKKRSEEEKISLYNLLYKKTFGPSGYSDTDFDTGISFSERVAAYRKMGFKDEIFIEGKEFPEPTLEQLEELVKKYERDN